MADISKISGALSAYQNAAKMGVSAGKADGGNSFSNMLGNVLNDSVGTLKQSEIASRGALVNEVSLDELAVAMANAEMTLRTIVAVRDRVISAYQDIIKMPI